MVIGGLVTATPLTPLTLVTLVMLPVLYVLYMAWFGKNKKRVNKCELDDEGDGKKLSAE